MIDFLVSKLVPDEIKESGLSQALRILESAQPADLVHTDVEQPIFILSAGWRSGSTLVQRLVCSNGRTIIWGEPFGDFIPIPRLASSIAGFRLNDEHLINTSANIKNPLVQEWIANLNPGPQALWKAHRAYFDTAFAVPARQNGYQRWGIKEVRLTGAHALYLKWLYPKGRIVLLVRNPLDAYASYHSLIKSRPPFRGRLFSLLHPRQIYQEKLAKNWYSIRPDNRMDSAYKFIAHWNYLTNSFFAIRDEVGVAWFRYEDLVSDHSQIECLSYHLSLPISEEVLARKIGESPDLKKYTLSSQVAYRLLASRTANKVGY